MSNIFDLLGAFADAENALAQTRFLAPCLPGSRITTRVNGMVCTFRPNARSFEGWGIWKPLNTKLATLDEEADFIAVDEYMELMQPVRLRLAYPMRGKTWLAFPANASIAELRLGGARPVPVHLVENGARFEQVVAAWDGAAFWYRDVDRRAEPEHLALMQQAYAEVRDPDHLRFTGMTPEMRSVYSMAVYRHLHEREIAQERELRLQARKYVQQIKLWEQKARNRGANAERRLRDALGKAGGNLQSFRDRDDAWLVNWTTSNGEHHSSIIDKQDLTVISSGICLSGYDNAFDLTSLVKVVEQRW